MNLRLPVVAAVVTVAAGAAIYRAGHAAAPPVATFASSAPVSDTASGQASRRPMVARTGIVVYVAGDVRRGGLYTLSAGARGMDALRAAGGAGPGADLVAVNLAQQLSDGDEVAVPSLGDASEPAPATAKRSHRSKHGKHARKRRHHRHRDASPVASVDANDANDPNDTSGVPASVVDLNTADESELETLPGVGATLAARIVAFREAAGSFSTPDDLLDVSGVTQSKLDAIEPYVTAGGTR